MWPRASQSSSCKFCPHLVSWFLRAGHCEPLSSPSACRILIFSPSSIDAFNYRYAYTSRTTHILAGSLHLVSFRRGTQGSLSWRRPGARPWASVPGNYPCLCCCVLGQWDKPTLSDAPCQRDFDGRSSHGVFLGLCRLILWERIFLGEQKIRVTESKFFCIDMYGRISLWSREWFPLVRYKSSARTVKDYKRNGKATAVKIIKIIYPIRLWLFVCLLPHLLIRANIYFAKALH